MMRFILNRVMQAALVLLIMSFVIYALIGLMPGDPIDLMLSSDPNMTSEDAERMKQLQGLHLPIHERWFNWLVAALQGDFGYSRLYKVPATEVLWPALLNTLKLLGASLLLSLIIAIPCGVYAALKPYSMRDYSINFVAFAGISIPVFWLGLMLIIVFAVILKIFPPGGIGDINGGGIWDSLRYMILPVATLTIGSVGGHTRFMRGSMMEVMRQDYIRTARAKGASTTRIVHKHALRNAMLPVVTILALECGTLFSGALITETVFVWPGMGKLIFDSIIGNDFNLALIALLLATCVTLACNLIADLAYGWLDPRIRHQ